jgi:lincosamide nucleotidyltransferase A/C/D/E
MGAPPRQPPKMSNLRYTALRSARALYYWTASSPAAALLDLRFFQRMRRRLKARMHEADMLEILGALDASQVQAWVAGGWGVDALLAEQTREHDDLDLVLDFAEEERAQAALAELGFRWDKKAGELFPGALMPKRFVMRDGPGRMVDLHGVDLRTWPGSWFEYLQRDGRLAFAIDPTDGFAEGSIAGRSVPCLSAGLQVASRQVYEPSDADRQDVTRLCARFDLPLPPDFEVRVRSESTP